MSEIERAIETLNVMQSMHSHIRKSNNEWDAIELSKDALRAALDRERNESLTCEGCKTWDIAKKYPYQIKRCSECSRQNGRTDRYEPKGEKHD